MGADLPPSTSTPRGTFPRVSCEMVVGSSTPSMAGADESVSNVSPKTGIMLIPTRSDELAPRRQAVAVAVGAVRMTTVDPDGWPSACVRLMVCAAVADSAPDFPPPYLMQHGRAKFR